METLTLTVPDDENLVLSAGRDRDGARIWSAHRNDRQTGRSLGTHYGAASPQQAVDAVYGGKA